VAVDHLGGKPSSAKGAEGEGHFTVLANEELKISDSKKAAVVWTAAAFFY
jgi:hypothetical protein